MHWEAKNICDSLYCDNLLYCSGWNQARKISKVCLYSSILSVSSSLRNLPQSLLTCFNLVFFALSSQCTFVLLDILFACLLCWIFCSEGLHKAPVIWGKRRERPWFSWFSLDLSGFGMFPALTSAWCSPDQSPSVISSPESKPLVFCQGGEEAVLMINRQVQQDSVSRSQRQIDVLYMVAKPV